MKANLHPADTVRQIRTLWASAELLKRSLFAALAGFFLAGCTVAETWLPLPICLAAALGMGVPSFAAYLAGCLGYLVFLPAQAAEPMAIGLLVQSGLCIFGGQFPKQERTYLVGSTVLFTALVGFLFLLEQRFVPRLLWRYLVRVLAAGGGVYVFLRALQERASVYRLILLGCLCAGLCAVTPFYVPLGAIAACALAAASLNSPMALFTAAVCGLALTQVFPVATAIFLLASVFSQMRSRVLQLSGWLGMVFMGTLLTDTSAVLPLCAVLGVGASFLLPSSKLFGEALPAEYADPRLGAASGLLSQMSSALAVADDHPEPEAAAVFDRTAERVCRMCSRWDDCWNTNVEETVTALEAAAPAMTARGKAVRSDLSDAFLERCRHVEGFLTAVNRELDDLSCRRTSRNRIRESRLVMAEQYDILAKALASEPPLPAAKYHYRVEVGFRSQSCPEQSVAGDRAVTFRVGKYFYLILCDGMGVGDRANAEAGTAIDVLRTLLQAGTAPSDAMEILNGVYLLRDDGGFSTVDLLQIDLTSGDALLLKWGAAPSYLKKRSNVEKIGTAAPPPGVGIGEEYLPELVKLSLGRGELLVLLSDGAVSTAAERFLRQYGGQSPKELAYGMLRCQDEAEDDKTVAAICLRSKA